MKIHKITVLNGFLLRFYHNGSLIIYSTLTSINNIFYKSMFWGIYFHFNVRISHMMNFMWVSLYRIKNYIIL